LTWMQSVWLPIVPELTASNALEIFSGRYVVLGVLSRLRPDDFMQSKRELKNAALEWMDKQTQLFQLERQEMRDAKQLRIEEAEDRNDQRALRNAKQRVISITQEDFRKGVNFAWVDGDFWERWIRTTYGVDVSKGERVIINDEDVSVSEEVKYYLADICAEPAVLGYDRVRRLHRAFPDFHP
jgi:protein disulfide-isomerase